MRLEWVLSWVIKLYWVRFYWILLIGFILRNGLMGLYLLGEQQWSWVFFDAVCKDFNLVVGKYHKYSKVKSGSYLWYLDSIVLDSDCFCFERLFNGFLFVRPTNMGSEIFLRMCTMT